jgi:hypothetical protein
MGSFGNFGSDGENFGKSLKCGSMQGSRDVKKVNVKPKLLVMDFLYPNPLKRGLTSGVGMGRGAQKVIILERLKTKGPGKVRVKSRINKSSTVRVEKFRKSEHHWERGVAVERKGQKSVQDDWGDLGDCGDSLSAGEQVVNSPKSCTNDKYKDDKLASDTHGIERHTGDKYASDKHYVEKQTNEDSDFRLPHTPDQRLPSPNSKATPGPLPRRLSIIYPSPGL